VIVAKKPARKPAMTSPDLDIAPVLERPRENIADDTLVCDWAQGRFIGAAAQSREKNRISESLASRWLTPTRTCGKWRKRVS
jgi:hypothetical protein